MNDLTLTFHDTTFNAIIGRDGTPWVTSPDLARAIGYARADKVARLYRRHAEEFTDNMTAVIRMAQPQFGAADGSYGESDTRIFSLRGAHLIAMFARTPRAAEFRRWVLDVLEGFAPHRQPANDPVADRYRLLGESEPGGGNDDLLARVKAMLLDSDGLTIVELADAVAAGRSDWKRQRIRLILGTHRWTPKIERHRNGHLVEVFYRPEPGR